MHAWVGHYKQFIQEHREDILKREGCLCCLWRKRKGLDEKVLLDLTCSFWIAWRIFQFVERQPTPESCSEKLHGMSLERLQGACSCRNSWRILWSQRVSLSFCPHTAFAYWKQTSPGVWAREKQECHHLPCWTSGKGARMAWKAFLTDTGDRDSTPKPTGF